jgi:hypothetical protein
MAQPTRLRNAKGRFIKQPKPPPLSTQPVGNAGALEILEETEPTNVLEMRTVFYVHDSWWEARHADERPT